MGRWEQDLRLDDIQTGAFDLVIRMPDPVAECGRIIAQCTNSDVVAFFTQLRDDLAANPQPTEADKLFQVERIADAAQGIEDRSAFSLDVRTDPEGLQVVVDQDGQVTGA